MGEHLQKEDTPVPTEADLFRINSKEATKKQIIEKIRSVVKDVKILGGKVRVSYQFLDTYKSDQLGELYKEIRALYKYRVAKINRPELVTDNYVLSGNFPMKSTAVACDAILDNVWTCLSTISNLASPEAISAKFLNTLSLDQLVFLKGDQKQKMLVTSWREKHIPTHFQRRSQSIAKPSKLFSNRYKDLKRYTRQLNNYFTSQTLTDADKLLAIEDSPSDPALPWFLRFIRNSPAANRCEVMAQLT
jgi:hypothetical protein